MLVSVTGCGFQPQVTALASFLGHNHDCSRREGEKKKEMILQVQDPTTLIDMARFLHNNWIGIKSHPFNLTDFMARRILSHSKLLIRPGNLPMQATRASLQVANGFLFGPSPSDQPVTPASTTPTHSAPTTEAQCLPRDLHYFTKNKLQLSSIVSATIINTRVQIHNSTWTKGCAGFRFGFAVEARSRHICRFCTPSLCYLTPSTSALSAGNTNHRVRRVTVSPSSHAQHFPSYCTVPWGRCGSSPLDYYPR